MSACLLEKEIRKRGIADMKNIPKKDLVKATEKVLHICRHFPGFPDIDLIINLSGQTYEGKECYSNVIFLPAQYEDYDPDYIVRYAEKIVFEPKNIRFIRKLLESVGRENYLVMKTIDDDYCVFGVISEEAAESLLAFRVMFSGHMSWKAAIKDQNLFKYQNGSYQPVNVGEFSQNGFLKKLHQAFGDKMKESDAETLLKITRVITGLGHGTSIVIYYSREKFESEIKRLTHTGAGHGIKLEREIDFSLCNEEETERILRPITKIDGGLILDIHGNCGAISCVFDGTIPEEYEQGTSSRGSRYNSLVLYIKTLHEKALGVVVSDDGSVDYITNT